jgi:tripartite-type tricarboxylate transporter receptor subunit TctC
MKRMAMAWLAMVFGWMPNLLWAQPDFYRGKLITLVQDSTPGGVGQLRTQALIPVLQKHIPGNPKIVVQFMPGAGGRKAANHLYSMAASDGLTIGRVGSGMVTGAILGLPGVQYDLQKFVYLGSGQSEGSHVFFTRKEAGLDNLDKLKKAKGVRVGGQSVGHSNYVVARLFAWLLDLKEPRFVVGFSGAEMDAALLQGELDARANSAETVVQRTPDFIKQGMMHFHGVAEFPRGHRFSHPAFKDLPALHTLAKGDKEKSVVSMFIAFMQFTQAFVLPPDSPNDRVKILKDAFRNSLNDPEFHDNWKKMTRAEASPLMPEELEELVKTIPRDPEVIKLYNLIAGAQPLPRR